MPLITQNTAGGGRVRREQGAMWLFYCFTFCPDVKLYGGTRVGDPLLQTDCCSQCDFPDIKPQLITDLAVVAQRPENSPCRNRKVQQWLTFAPQINVTPGSRHHQRALKGTICSQVYIHQFPETTFPSLTVLRSIRWSDICPHSN